MEKDQEHADVVGLTKLSLDVADCLFADDAFERYIPKSASRKQEVVEAKEDRKCKWIL